MRIKITNPAYVDLDEIDDYIRSNNSSAADRMATRIDEAIDFLATYPAMGRVGRKFKTREFVISGTPFILIYQVKQQFIAVLRVLHTAQKWPNNKNKH